MNLTSSVYDQTSGILLRRHLFNHLGGEGLGVSKRNKKRQRP